MPPTLDYRPHPSLRIAFALGDDRTRASSWLPLRALTTASRSPTLQQRAFSAVRSAGCGGHEFRAGFSHAAETLQKVAPPVIYVAASSSSSIQDGLSWATALTDLQTAIKLASVSKAAVWVKAGEYRPAKRTDRIAAFILYDDLKVYGGFAGNETALAQRPAGGPQTTLSAKTAAGDYRYPHVLYGADDVLLDGLTVRDGDAHGFTYNSKGGGLLAYRAGDWPLVDA